MKQIKKGLVYTLAGSMLLSNIAPALAYTYKDSVADVEYTDITENATNNTTVYAEVGSFFKVTIPKHIILNGTTKSGTYTVSVEGDIAGTEFVNVIPDESFALKSNNLKDVTASIAQDKTSWEYAEILADSKVIGNGTIDAKDITAGSWNGNFNFNISLHDQLNIHTVTFNANGGNCDIAEAEIEYGAAYGELPTAVKSGHTFDGWYNEDGEQITPTTSVKNNKNHTVYAQYTKIDTTAPTIVKGEWSTSASSYPQTGRGTRATGGGLVTDTESGIKSIIVTLYRPNNSIIKTYDTTNSGRWLVDISYTEAGSVDYVRVHVCAEDNAGNISEINYYGGWGPW